MQQSFMKLAGVAALAAGMAFGQSAPAQNQRPRAGNHMMLDRLGADLNLTDSQKQQAQSIFQASRQSAQSVHDQLRQSREALAAAVKSGASDAEIDKLASGIGPLMAQTTAIHTKAFAKFYAILTPEQKDKVGQRLDHMMDGVQGMRGRWQGRQQNGQAQPTR